MDVKKDELLLEMEYESIEFAKIIKCEVYKAITHFNEAELAKRCA